MQIRPQEIALAAQLVESLAAEFDPGKYRDEYQMQLAALIESKKQGSEINGAAPRKLAPVINLVQGLQQSLRQTSSKKAAANESSTEPESPKRPTKRQRAARQAVVAWQRDAPIFLCDSCRVLVEGTINWERKGPHANVPSTLRRKVR